ncbi:uncharacterized protein EDB91DRAFT_251982 [Suillus paluster]|uniref:uncharacterized protein n=1 Tax=Suillus paluster TaxID=48578 RepID=UPI001B871C86|nr:uncharacterized protein EDB91DRAFT_251982 [Suillus paluster]KAG1754777.1 hypothetical protein EDB91DRAFT_251982 [Suillus paluster]
MRFAYVVPIFASTLPASCLHDTRRGLCSTRAKLFVDHRRAKPLTILRSEDRLDAYGAMQCILSGLRDQFCASFLLQSGHIELCLFLLDSSGRLFVHPEYPCTPTCFLPLWL